MLYTITAELANLILIDTIMLPLSNLLYHGICIVVTDRIMPHLLLKLNDCLGIYSIADILTHCGLMTPYRDIDLDQYWFR